MSVGEFFDSAGLVITILLGLAAIAVPIWVYLKQRSRKEFSKDVQVTQLVNIHSEARDRITIHYEGEQIKQVHLVEIGLANSGNVPIRPEDFERPLTIELGLGVPITVDVAGTTPEELEPEIQLTGRGVELQPLLLNAGDSLKFKVLVRDFVGKVAFDYRIVGISRLVDTRVQAERSWLRLLGANSSLRLATVSATAAVGLGIVTASAGDLFTDDSPERRLVPAYAYPQYAVRFRDGKVICAGITGYGRRRGYVTLARDFPNGRIFQMVPRSQIKSIRRNC